MTRKTNEEYVETPGQCPFCDSGQIEAGDHNFFGNLFIQDVYCKDCGGEWEDNYTLVGYDVTSLPTGATDKEEN